MLTDSYLPQCLKFAVQIRTACRNIPNSKLSQFGTDVLLKDYRPVLHFSYEVTIGIAHHLQDRGLIVAAGK
jgi:hypothetical protein